MSFHDNAIIKNNSISLTNQRNKTYGITPILFSNTPSLSGMITRNSCLAEIAAGFDSLVLPGYRKCEGAVVLMCLAKGLRI